MYCNYTKDKFGNELTFIKPCWGEFGETKNCNSQSWTCELATMSILGEIEKIYQKLIHNCWIPQQAATILPNALKTELIMTGFAEDWKHFFDLRALGTTGAPHPQAKELALPLMEEFTNRGYI